LSPSAFAKIVYNNNEQSPYLTVASIKITPSSFLDLCPALLVQIEQKACDIIPSKVSASDEHQHQKPPRVDTLRAWTYAFISIFVISICGVFGIILVPLAKSQMYDKILRFLVALATGTLCGDALMVNHKKFS
jgi:solute carrier family 39 (zinc transporter), member 5